MNNIQSVSDSYLCSACGACHSICVRRAITFHESPIGRKYAVVDDKCTDCGMCRKVCPSLDAYSLTSDMEDKYVGTILGTYIGRATCQVIYANAQSGGVCTALLTHMFESGEIDGAVVVKMDYGITPQVRGVLVTTPAELLKSQKSCYTPVDLLSVLESCRDCKSIAVVGLPCHIEAVENLQRTNPRLFGNIVFRIGLICDRTMAGGISDIVCRLACPSEERVKISWRDKSVGETKGTKKKSGRYKQAPLVVCNEHGEKVVLPRYIRMCLKDMFTPPRCRVCYDKLNVWSDITLGDPWGMSGVDWENGDSLIITRTENGARLLKSAEAKGAICIQKGDREEMLKGQVVEKRRESVRRYSQAYRTLSFAISVPILENNATTDYGKELKMLRTFVETDTMDKEEIYKSAISTIVTYERNNRFVNRLLRKMRKKLGL